MCIKNIYGTMAVTFIAIWLGSCRNEDVDYYPIGKKHLGETYTEYVINNVLPGDTVNRIVLNFYPEEITSLSYMTYDESACTFNFSRGETAKYLLSWDYDTDGSYVEVQYGQNGMWHTVNGQKHSGEYLLTANDGMSVRMSIRSGGSVSYSGGQVKYSIGVTVNRFSIEEADEGR